MCPHQYSHERSEPSGFAKSRQQPSCAATGQEGAGRGLSTQRQKARRRLPDRIEKTQQNLCGEGQGQCPGHPWVRTPRRALYAGVSRRRSHRIHLRAEASTRS